MRACASICSGLPPVKMSPHDGDRLAADRALRRHCRRSDASVGRLSGAGLCRSAHVIAAADRSPRNRALSSCGHQATERTELVWVRNLLSGLSRGRNYRALWVAAAAVGFAAQPPGHDGGCTRSGFEHRGQLRHQHQLAVLRRRDDAQLFKPDGRHHRAIVSFRCFRHGRRHRLDPRLRATPRGHDRQFLGRSDARHALRAAADLRRRRIVSHDRRRAADAGRLRPK